MFFSRRPVTIENPDLRLCERRVSRPIPLARLDAAAGVRPSSGAAASNNQKGFNKFECAGSTVRTLSLGFSASKRYCILRTPT